MLFLTRAARAFEKNSPLRSLPETRETDSRPTQTRDHVFFFLLQRHAGYRAQVREGRAGSTATARLNASHLDAPHWPKWPVFAARHHRMD